MCNFRHAARMFMSGKFAIKHLEDCTEDMSNKKVPVDGIDANPRICFYDVISF